MPCSYIENDSLIFMQISLTGTEGNITINHHLRLSPRIQLASADTSWAGWNLCLCLTRLGGFGILLGGKPGQRDGHNEGTYYMRRVLGGWALLCLVMLLVQACGYSVADCVPNDHKICREGVIYWVDSCDKEGDKVGDCECGCNADLSGCEDPCECTPECNSKCCGPDGCGATCPDNCPTGYVCNAQSCECESERE